jgi:hypothetical protein
MKMRLYVEEQHVIRASELDEFISNKEQNGFTIKNVSNFEIAGTDKKLVIIEKWNKSVC